jgi:hypothetical protein
MNHTTRNILVALMAFLGIGAVGGGGVLIVSPSGGLIGMPLSMLNKSPFNTFLVPGIILFAVLGVVPLVLARALVKKPKFKFAESINLFPDMHWSWTFSIYTAFALVIWIQVQMTFLHAVHPLHSFYMLLALFIIFAALFPNTRSFYRK